MLSKIFKYFLFPLLFYLLSFILLTYPLILSFSTHLFADDQDGLQNFWNLWWVNYAVTGLHTSPYFTNVLHYPYGTSLVPHALNPVNGIFYIFLSPFLGPFASHNVILILTFVLGGLFAFYLCLRFSKSFAGSLTGGFIYAFSSYHFLHSRGHLEMATIEFIPLFFFFFHNFCRRPAIKQGFLASFSLILVFLSSYYYFFFCVLAGIFLFLFLKKSGFKKYIPGIILISIFTLLTSGIIIFKLLQIINTDGLIGGHASEEYSMDLLSPFIPGNYSFFNQWSKPFWSKLSKDIEDESGVYLGWASIFLLILAIFKRKDIKLKGFRFWWFMFLVFFILSLGPKLHIAGQKYDLLLPYKLLELFVPGFRDGGVPVRMIIISMLSISVISSASLEYLLKKERFGKIITVIIFIIIIIESLPAKLPSTNIGIPGYVYVLKNSNQGGFLDAVSPYQYQLYFQTIHGKPLALGYLSRLPNSVSFKGRRLVDLVISNGWKTICSDYKIRYILAGSESITLGRLSGIKKIFSENGTVLFDLSGVKECRIL